MLCSHPGEEGAVVVVSIVFIVAIITRSRVDRSTEHLSIIIGIWGWQRIYVTFNFRIHDDQA